MQAVQSYSSASSSSSASVDARFSVHSDDLEATTYCVLSTAPLGSTAPTAHFARPERATKVDLQSVLAERKAVERRASDERRRAQAELKAEFDREREAERERERDGAGEAKAPARMKTHGRLRSIFRPANTPAPPSPTKDAASSPQRVAHHRPASALRSTLPLPRAPRGSIHQLGISTPIEVTRSTQPALVPFSISPRPDDDELVISAASTSAPRSSFGATSPAATTPTTPEHSPRPFRSTAGSHRSKPTTWFSRSGTLVSSASTPGSLSTPALSCYSQSASQSSLSLISSPSLSTPTPFYPSYTPTEPSQAARERRRRPSVPEAALKSLMTLGRRGSTKAPSRPPVNTISDEELNTWRRPVVRPDTDMEVLGVADDDPEAQELVVAPAPVGGTRTLSLGRKLDDEVLVIESPTSSPAASVTTFDSPRPGSIPSFARSSSFRFPSPAPPPSLATTVTSDDESDMCASFSIADRFLSSPESPLPPSPPPERSSPSLSQRSFSSHPQLSPTAFAAHARPGLTPAPRPRIARGTTSSPPSTLPPLSPPTGTPIARRYISDEAWARVSLSARAATSRKPSATPLHDLLQRAGDDGRARDQARRPFTPPPSPPNRLAVGEGRGTRPGTASTAASSETVFYEFES